MITPAWTLFANQCSAVAIGGAESLSEERRQRFATLRKNAQATFPPYTKDNPSHHQTLLLAIAGIIAAPNRPTAAQFAALSAAVEVERAWRRDVQELELRLSRSRGNYPPVGLDL